MAARFRLRRAAYAELTEAAGLPKIADVAAAMGKNHSTVYRVLHGRCDPGEAFIASLVMALRERGQDVDTEDLFEIVDVIPHGTEVAGEAA